MRYIKKSLIFFVFQGLVGFITSPSQAIDSRDDATHHIVSPMPGQLVTMFVETGQHVRVGDSLCILEAMKMQMAIRSEFCGIIHSIFFRVGDIFEESSLLMILLPPESVPQPLTPPSFNALPSNKEKENKALPIRQDKNNQQARIPSNPPPLSLWRLGGNPVPEPVLTTLLPSFPSSFSLPAFSEPTNPALASPLGKNAPSFDNGGKPDKNSALDGQKNARGIRRKPLAQPVHPQEAIVPFDKIEKPSFKKRGKKEGTHSASGFSQGAPRGFLKPSLFDDAAGYSIIACAKWMVGLAVLGHLLFALKTMACFLLRRPFIRKLYLAICPLPKIAYIRAVDFNKQTVMAKQRAHNRNRIGRGFEGKARILGFQERYIPAGNRF